MTGVAEKQGKWKGWIGVGERWKGVGRERRGSRLEQEGRGRDIEWREGNAYASGRVENYVEKCDWIVLRT